MMISNKIIKYINNIIHHTYFNTIYNNDKQKQYIKQNLLNILKNNTNNDITTLCTNEVKKIIRKEIKYYFDTEYEEIENQHNYINLLFDKFIDLYRKSITLNNLLEDIYNHNNHKITDLFIESWDTIIFNNVLYIIIDSIKKYIYTPNVCNINIENIMYILKSKFNHQFIYIINTIKSYREEYYSIKETYTLGTYIKHYQEYMNKETELETKYDFYNRINFRDELGILFFKTNYNKLMVLYNKSIETNIEHIMIADSYLNKYTDNYGSLVNLVISYLEKEFSHQCSFKRYIFIYNKIKNIYSIDTFKNIAEPSINKRFKFIKLESNIEDRLITLILDDLKKNILSEYTKLILFVDTNIFITNYIKHLCKRIINRKVNIKVELEYYSEFKKYDIDLYKIDLILGDISINRSINEELHFCKTNIITGRYMIWPLKKKVNALQLPKSFEEEHTKIKNWYSIKFPSRTLYFTPNLLRCDITFNGYKLNIKGCYADILLKFNSSDYIDSDNIPHTLEPFVKINLLEKKENKFYINDNFYSKHKSIKIN